MAPTSTTQIVHFATKPAALALIACYARKGKSRLSCDTAELRLVVREQRYSLGGETSDRWPFREGEATTSGPLPV